MTIVDFISKNFWLFVLLWVLCINERTYIVGILLCVNLAVTGGTCNIYMMIFIGIFGILLYLFPIHQFWKNHYINKIKFMEKEILLLKRKIEKYEK